MILYTTMVESEQSRTGVEIVQVVIYCSFFKFLLELFFQTHETIRLNNGGGGGGRGGAGGAGRQK